MSYESIVITKHATNVWFAKDNTLPGGVAGHFVSGWSGGVNSDQFTLKSKNGGIVYNNQPWNIFSYVDNLDSGNNFTPTSAVDLVVKLTQRDFFEYSSSGGAGVDTWLQLLDVLIGSYAGRANQVVVVAPGENGLTTVTPSFAFQNNIGKAQNFTKSGSMWVNNIGMANYVNDNVTINVTETNTPVVLRVQNTTDGVTTQYLYFFFAGKGTWGEGGTATTQSHFYYITERRLTPTDVEDVPNSEIFPLGDTTGDNFWDVASLQDPPYDLNDSGELDENGNPRTYYFSFTDTGVLKFAQFIGTPGYYGVGENSFVMADFVVVTDDTITPTPNLEMVTGTGNTTTYNMVSNDPVNGNKISREAKGEKYTDPNGNTIYREYPDDAATGDATYKEPVKTGVQTYAMLSDITPSVSVLAASGQLQSDELKDASSIVAVFGGSSSIYMNISFVFNATTGTITGGFPITNGKTYLIFYKKP